MLSSRIRLGGSPKFRNDLSMTQYAVISTGDF